MKMRQTENRPCRMGHGELRRVPQNRAFGLVGYYVGCPRCGFVTAIIQGDEGLAITERDGTVSFSAPAVCVACCVRIHLESSDARLEETPDVRPVRA